MKIIIEVSARHAHLCQKDLNKLFGDGYKLHKLKQLSQKTDFTCKETVTIKTSQSEFKNVRIIGPLRDQTQVEVSRTDSIKLGLNPPLRLSGYLVRTPGVTIIGPKGSVKLKEGVIIAQRHIHTDVENAENYNLKNGQEVSVMVNYNNRGLTFHHVKIRVGLGYVLRMHIDTDEGNAAGIDKIGEGIIVE